VNILIIRFTSLGDLVTLEPAFRAYRHFFSGAHITLLTSGLGRGIYEDTGYFDEYVVDKNFLNTVQTLKQREYDIVINLQCTRPSHWITLLLKKGKLINRSASMLQKYLHIKTNVKSHTEILVESGYDPKEVEAFFATNNTILLPYTQGDFAWKEGSQKVIALAPGASERWESKKWGDKNYLELAGGLLNTGYKVVLIGSSLEKEAGAEIEATYPGVINLIAKTNLVQLKGLLASVDLLVCNDSGPAHLAAGVGTDTVTIFGSTDIKHCVFFGAYRGTHRYLVAEPRLDCQPCYKSKCPTQHECMANIHVESVLNIINELISRKMS